MYSIRSTSDISEVPGGSGNSDKIGDVVATITDLEDTYHCLLRTLIAEQKAIEEIIATLEPIERLLIRARYIENQPWESVCGIIGYSWAQTHRVHANILNKLSE